MKHFTDPELLVNSIAIGQASCIYEPIEDRWEGTPASYEGVTLTLQYIIPAWI